MLSKTVNCLQLALSSQDRLLVLSSIYMHFYIFIYSSRGATHGNIVTTVMPGMPRWTPSQKAVILPTIRPIVVGLSAGFW